MNLYDYKFTPWRGIDVVRQVSMISRLSTVGPTDCRFLRAAESTWKKPRAWNRKAASWREYEDAIRGTGAVNNQGPYVRPRILLTVDPFADVPQAWRDELFALMEECDELDWLVVTERPEKWHGMLPLDWLASSHPTDNWIPRNVWFGARIHTQADADRMIPHLLGIPAKTRFVLAELREKVNLVEVVIIAPVPPHKPGVYLNALTGHLIGPDDMLETQIHWLICSGARARVHPDWVRALRDQAQGAGVPFWFEGWGEWVPRSRGEGVFNTLAAHNRDRLVDAAGNVHCTHDAAGPGAVPMSRVGSKNSGRILDGRTWEEVPK